MTDTSPQRRHTTAATRAAVSIYPSGDPRTLLTSARPPVARLRLRGLPSHQALIAAAMRSPTIARSSFGLIGAGAAGYLLGGRILKLKTCDCHEPPFERRNTFVQIPSSWMVLPSFFQS